MMLHRFGVCVSHLDRECCMIEERCYTHQESIGFQCISPYWLCTFHIDRNLPNRSQVTGVDSILNSRTYSNIRKVKSHTFIFVSRIYWIVYYNVFTFFSCNQYLDSFILFVQLDGLMNLKILYSTPFFCILTPCIYT